MIFATYDEQRSFPEYVDMEFKELVIKPEYEHGSGLPIYDWIELMEYMLNGYFIDFCDVPEYVLNEDFGGKNKRRFKKFVKKTFDKFGDSKNAIAAHVNLEVEIERLNAEHLEELNVECLEKLELPSFPF